MIYITKIRPDEWIFLIILVAVVALNIFFLLVSFKRSHLDDLECSKYSVFTNDPFPKDKPEPEPPLYCKLTYPKSHSLWQKDLGVNKNWIWLIIFISLVWVLVILGAFLSSHVIVHMH